MDWFEGRQRALDQDTAVYDLFTVARPKHKKPKKVERAKSSQRQRQATVHDKHTSYDRNIKQLQLVTNMRAPPRGMVFIDDGALSKSQRILENYQTAKATENISLKVAHYQKAPSRTQIQCDVKPVVSAPAPKESA